MIIRRKRYERILRKGGRIFIYGRRKTGKTFFVKNFYNYSRYFFVQRDGNIIELKSGEYWKYIEFRRFLLTSDIDKIVIDEIQRLPSEVLDIIHARADGIKDMILMSSSMSFSEKILGKNSPIMNLFLPVRFELVDPEDLLLDVKDLKVAIFLQEPWLIPFYEKYKKDFFSILRDFLYLGVSSLIGEILDEESKRSRDIYEAILKAISVGSKKLKEIANYLYNVGLISSPESTRITYFIQNSIRMGLIESIRIFGSESYRYRYVSPVIDFFYYLNSRYGYPEVQVREKEFLKILGEKIPNYVERFFERLLSNFFGMKPVIISKPDLEIDIALTEFQKLKVVGEVKWRKDIDKDELEEVEEKLSKFKDCRKILIVPNKGILPYEPKGIEVWDVKKILELLKKGL